MSHLSRSAEVAFATPPAYAPHCEGFSLAGRIGREDGARHAEVGTARLAPGGRLDPHLHSYEELVFVLAGAPRLALGGVEVELGPDAAVAIGAGETHSWSNPGEEEARWIELRTPPARPEGEPVDTIFTARASSPADAVPLDPGDPRLAAFGRWTPDGSTPAGPLAAGMAAPTQSLPGIKARMVLDGRHGAVAARTFVIEFAPDAKLGLHDHPFEETFYVLEGEIAFDADGVERTLRAGDVAFAGVGCLHGFENRSGFPCRWLESQSPLPPGRGDTRVQAPWETLAARFA
ncbi:MAG: hypothetical protein BGO11_03275 [Solirubrobacterales bacterium 70-9]|nr:MAG: hypothetical protein BGO11_03275 [Solirubrobacterales bacterium 70-9]